MTEAIQPELDMPAVMAEPEVQGRSLWYFVWRRLRRNHTAMLGGILFILLVLVAFVGYFYGASSFALSTRDVRIPPTAAHWFGTDDLGRDIFTRILYGAHLTI